MNIFFSIGTAFNQTIRYLFHLRNIETSSVMENEINDFLNAGNQEIQILIPKYLKNSHKK